MNATRYWSRTPGKFVHPITGLQLPGLKSGGPNFQGTVREWYETLVQTIVSVVNDLQKQAAPCNRDQVDVFVSPNVSTILMCSILLHVADKSRTRAGKRKIGTIADMHIYEDSKLQDARVYVKARFKQGSKKLTLNGDVRLLDMWS